MVAQKAIGAQEQVESISDELPVVHELRLIGTLEAGDTEQTLWEVWQKPISPGKRNDSRPQDLSFFGHAQPATHAPARWSRRDGSRPG